MRRPPKWLPAGIVAFLVGLVIALFTSGDDDSSGAALPGDAAELEAVDIAEEVGIFEITHTYFAGALDYNANGWEDLLLVRHKLGVRLYENVGGRFENRSQRLMRGLDPLDRHRCAFADVNASGRIDIFCTVGGFLGQRPNPSELWIQQEDGSFVESAEPYGVQDPYGRSRDAVFLNANGDEWPDLFVGNQYPRRDGHPATNTLFVNEGGEGFRNAPELGLDLTIGADSVQAIDLDGNGYDDLAVCGKNERPLYLFENREGGGFADASGRIEGGRSCRVAHFADIDGDGGLDLVRLTGRQLIVHRHEDGELVRTYERELAAGRKLAIGDATGDGRPDVFVLRSAPERNLPDELLLNRSSGARIEFERIEVPTDLRGVGDSVATIDHDRDGRAGFIVMNGKEKARGAVQLIILREKG